jgi:hypothetical protein
MEVRFALANVPDIKFATSSNAKRTSRASERNNVRKKISELLRDNITLGYHIWTLESRANFTVLIRMTLSYRLLIQSRMGHHVILERTICAFLAFVG